MPPVHEARCPNCGAAVPQSVFSQRAVPCAYCGTILTVAVASQAPNVVATPAGDAPPQGGSLEGWAVSLTDPGPSKINTIREIREITGCGLREAKDFSEKLPSRFPVRDPKLTRADVERRLAGCAFTFVRVR